MCESRPSLRAAWLLTLEEANLDLDHDRASRALRAAEEEEVEVTPAQRVGRKCRLELVERDDTILVDGLGSLMLCRAHELAGTRCGE